MEDILNSFGSKLRKKKEGKSRIRYMTEKCVLCSGNVDYFEKGGRSYFSGRFSPGRYSEFSGKDPGKVCAECRASHQFANCPTCGALNRSSTFHPDHCAKCSDKADRLGVTCDEYDELSGEWKAIYTLQADVKELKAQIRALKAQERAKKRL